MKKFFILTALLIFIPFKSFAEFYDLLNTKPLFEVERVKSILEMDLESWNSMVEYIISTDPDSVSINYDQLLNSDQGLNLHNRQYENLELSTYLSFVNGKAFGLYLDYVLPKNTYDNNEIEKIFSVGKDDLEDHFRVDTHLNLKDGYIGDSVAPCGLLVECKQILRFIISNN